MLGPDETGRMKGAAVSVPPNVDPAATASESCVARSPVVATAKAALPMNRRSVRLCTLQPPPIVPMISTPVAGAVALLSPARLPRYGRITRIRTRQKGVIRESPRFFLYINRHGNAQRHAPNLGRSTDSWRSWLPDGGHTCPHPTTGVAGAATRGRIRIGEPVAAFARICTAALRNRPASAHGNDGDPGTGRCRLGAHSWRCGAARRLTSSRPDEDAEDAVSQPPGDTPSGASGRSQSSTPRPRDGRDGPGGAVLTPGAAQSALQAQGDPERWIRECRAVSTSRRHGMRCLK
jgi:hypothetical protein